MRTDLLLASIARVCVLNLCGLPVAWACTCISPGVKWDLANSAVVFRGVVTDILPFPMHPEGGRPRYAVTFSVSEYWKGIQGRRITLHIIEPGTDCIGAKFDKGKEYVIFARSQEAGDYRLEERFWHGWLDVLPKGSRLLTVNNACDSTAEAKNAAGTEKELGKGRKP